ALHQLAVGGSKSDQDRLRRQLANEEPGSTGPVLPMTIGIEVSPDAEGHARGVITLGGSHMACERAQRLGQAVADDRRAAVIAVAQRRCAHPARQGNEPDSARANLSRRRDALGGGRKPPLGLGIFEQLVWCDQDLFNDDAFDLETRPEQLNVLAETGYE